jgi:hypothetical protein
MDIQTLLIDQAKGNLRLNYPTPMLNKAKKSLDIQMKLIGLCQNKTAIPQANAMQSLLTKIQTELNRRSDETNV